VGHDHIDREQDRLQSRDASQPMPPSDSRHKLRTWEAVEFMELFFDFTGSGEPGYPAGQPTLGQMLTQAVAAKEAGSVAPGPLVLVVGSASGRRLSEEKFRADRASGFYEMTAITPDNQLLSNNM
jgi:hypothetical protein